MALIKPVVIPSKTIKGGKNKVRISLAHNGETRYIVTDIILNSNKEFKNGMVVKRPDAAVLNTKIRKILQRYQTALDEIEFINGLTCSELVFQVTSRGNNRHRSLKSVYEEYLINSNAAPGTKRNYVYMWRNICRVFSGETTMESITHTDILSYNKHLYDRKLKAGTIIHNLTFFMSLFNYARNCGYVQMHVNPFRGLRLPKPEVRDSWLTVEQIKQIRDISTCKPNVRKCRDLFMLSYYLGGINMTDLLDIDFNEHPNVIKYIRKKTKSLPKANKYVEFTIPDEAREIISRLKDKDGYIGLTASERKNLCHFFFYWNMPKLAEAAGIKEVIYYSARKSFSQHAFNLGISTSVIDYILGHKVDKGGSSLYNYITVSPAIATEAVRKVLDNLK